LSLAQRCAACGRQALKLGEFLGLRCHVMARWP
jgi:hypothetical protein